VSAKINDLIGIPFLLRGRDIDQGVDCWGLAAHALRMESIEIMDAWKNIADAWDDGDSLDHLPEPDGWEEIDPQEATRLDVIIIGRRAAATHVGIVGEDGWMLHTSARDKGQSELVQLRRMIRAGLVHSAWRSTC